MKPISRLIAQPSRSSRPGAVIITAVILLFSIIPFTPQPDAWPAGAAVLILAAALILGQLQAVQVALLAVLISGTPLLRPGFREWPYSLLVPVILYLVVMLSIPRLRVTLLQWLRPGRLGKEGILLVTATAAIAGVALYVWYLAARPELHEQFRHMPPMPLWLYPAAGFGFAVGNAAIEEFVFRGAIMQALDSAFGQGAASIVLQGWLFGALHYLRGFPRGASGVAMAAVYGIMLGAVRRRSRGMLGPWLSHVCADAVIFAILAAVLLHSGKRL